MVNPNSYSKMNNKQLSMLVDHFSDIAKKCLKLDDWQELNSAFGELNASSMEHLEI